VDEIPVSANEIKERTTIGKKNWAVTSRGNGELPVLGGLKLFKSAWKAQMCDFSNGSYTEHYIYVVLCIIVYKIALWPMKPFHWIDVDVEQ